MVYRILRNILDGIAREGKGQILPAVLILLLMGTLLIVPSLSFAITSMKGNTEYRQRTNQLYAADAGVKDAVWLFQYDPTNAKIPPDSPCPANGTPYNVDGADGLNGEAVSVRIDCVSASSSNAIYKITSTAGDTSVTTYIESSPGLLDNAATTAGEIRFSGSAVVTGDVVGCTGDRITIVDCDVPWPTEAELTAFYCPQVNNCTGSVGYSTINTFVTHTVGPIYRNGDLDICSSNNGGMLTLTGTIFVDDDLNIGGPGCGGDNGTFTLDMNGQTIYVTKTAEVGNKVTITGAGAIIVIKEIKTFEPVIAAASLDDFLFIMAVEQRLHNFKPTGEFYGAIAGGIISGPGGADVDVQGTTILTHHSPPAGGMNVPTENMGDTRWTARNWSSSQ